jgi:hypothetical protein
VVVGFFVDEEIPREAFAAGEWECSEVDSERHPQLAAWSNSCWPAGFELTIQTDGFLADQYRVPVLIGEIESPLMFHVGLVPWHADPNSDGDVLRPRSNDTKTAAENEQLAIGDLHGIGHQNDGPECRRVKRQIRLLHDHDPTGRRIAREPNR